MMVPEHWIVARASDTPLRSDGPALINMFTDPTDALTNASVLSQVLTREITAADLLHHFLSTRKDVAASRELV